jgi:hypothetical protein
MFAIGLSFPLAIVVVQVSRKCFQREIRISTIELLAAIIY